MKEWRAKNPEKAYHYDPEIGRRNSLRINFGISVDAYEAMNAAQGGLCGICGKTDATGRRLAVDHCHATGKIRGLLCGVCNTGIGKLGDTVDRLERALAYLKRNAAQNKDLP